MKLQRINYGSAVYFLIFFWILNLVTDLVYFSIPALRKQLYNGNFYYALVIVPIVIGFIAYAVALLGIWVYNFVAKRYPISWEVSKK